VWLDNSLEIDGARMRWCKTTKGLVIGAIAAASFGKLQENGVAEQNLWMRQEAVLEQMTDVDKSYGVCLPPVSWFLEDLCFSTKH
jgi:hypothetical protein